MIKIKKGHILSDLEITAQTLKTIRRAAAEMRRADL